MHDSHLCGSSIFEQARSMHACFECYLSQGLRGKRLLEESFRIVSLIVEHLGCLAPRSSYQRCPLLGPNLE